MPFGGENELGWKSVTWQRAAGQYWQRAADTRPRQMRKVRELWGKQIQRGKRQE